MNNHGRPVGVRMPPTQSTEQAPQMTVTKVAPLQVALVEYGDERGMKHTTVAFIAGDKAFIPPNGESWTSGFKSFVSAINEQIMAKLPANNGPSGTPMQQFGSVPTTDAVDVTGGGAISDGALAEAVEEPSRKD